MIQRIQSLFLLLSVITMSLMTMFPIAVLDVEGQLYTFHFFGFVLQETGEVVLPALPIAILTGFIILISLVSIFLFKKRNLQMRLCTYNIILMLGLIGFIAYYIYSNASELNAIISYSWAAIMPLISIVLTIMARGKIRKDELLVKSVDRIR